MEDIERSRAGHLDALESARDDYPGTQPVGSWVETSEIGDLAERRRIQNRIAQRNYRKKLKKRLEELEKRSPLTDEQRDEQTKKIDDARIVAKKVRLGKSISSENINQQEHTWKRPSLSLRRSNTGRSISKQTDTSLSLKPRKSSLSAHSKGSDDVKTPPLFSPGSYARPPSGRHSSTSLANPVVTSPARSPLLGQEDTPFGPSSSNPKEHVTPIRGKESEHDEDEIPEVDPWNDEVDGPISIKCICGFTDDKRHILRCEKCVNWQHIACYYENAQQIVEVHECVECSPRALENPSGSSYVPRLQTNPQASTYGSGSLKSKVPYKAKTAGKSSVGFGSKSASQSVSKYTAATSEINFEKDTKTNYQSSIYVTLPQEVDLFEYLARPLVCPAPRCPHRFLHQHELDKHKTYHFLEASAVPTEQERATNLIDPPSKAEWTKKAVFAFGWPSDEEDNGEKDRGSGIYSRRRASPVAKPSLSTSPSLQNQGYLQTSVSDDSEREAEHLEGVNHFRKVFYHEVDGSSDLERLESSKTLSANSVALSESASTVKPTTSEVTPSLAGSSRLSETDSQSGISTPTVGAVEVETTTLLPADEHALKYTTSQYSSGDDVDNRVSEQAESLSPNIDDSVETPRSSTFDSATPRVAMRGVLRRTTRSFYSRSPSELSSPFPQRSASEAAYEIPRSHSSSLERGRPRARAKGAIPAAKLEIDALQSRRQDNSRSQGIYKSGSSDEINESSEEAGHFTVHKRQVARTAGAGRMTLAAAAAAAQANLVKATLPSRSRSQSRRGGDRPLSSRSNSRLGSRQAGNQQPETIMTPSFSKQHIREDDMSGFQRSSWSRRWRRRRDRSPSSSEHSDSKLNDGHSADFPTKSTHESTEFQRDPRDQSRSRSSSPQHSKRSDRVPRVSQSRTTFASGSGNSEIRLRVDASAPLSLQFNGEMEGRTLQIQPAEGGMSDIVIGGARHGRSDSNSRANWSNRSSTSSKRSSAWSYRTSGSSNRWSNATSIQSYGTSLTIPSARGSEPREKSESRATNRRSGERRTLHRLLGQSPGSYDAFTLKSKPSSPHTSTAQHDTYTPTGAPLDYPEPELPLPDMRLSSSPRQQQPRSGSDNDKTWTNTILLDVQRALNDIGAYIETVRLPGDNSGIVGLRRKFEWILSHHEKLISRQQYLTLCHLSLIAALQAMQHAEMNNAPFGGHDHIFEAPEDESRPFFSLPTVFDFADFAATQGKVSSEIKVFINLIQRVRQDLTEASRLYAKLSEPVSKAIVGSSAPTSWSERLKHHCKQQGLKEPTWRAISESRGARTAWKSIVMVNGTEYSSTLWYDGKYLEQAVESAAEEAIKQLENHRGSSTSARTFQPTPPALVSYNLTPSSATDSDQQPPAFAQRPTVSARYSSTPRNINEDQFLVESLMSESSDYEFSSEEEESPDDRAIMPPPVLKRKSAHTQRPSLRRTRTVPSPRPQVPQSPLEEQPITRSPASQHQASSTERISPPKVGFRTEQTMPNIEPMQGSSPCGFDLETTIDPNSLQFKDSLDGEVAEARDPAVDRHQGLVQKPELLFEPPGPTDRSTDPPQQPTIDDRALYAKDDHKDSHGLEKKSSWEVEILVQLAVQSLASPNPHSNKEQDNIPQWHNSAIGQRLGTLTKTYTVWETAGASENLAGRLSHSVSEVLQSSSITDESLSSEIVMIGRSKQNMQLALILTSPERDLRKLALDAIKHSDIPEKYPGTAILHMAPQSLHHLGLDPASKRSTLSSSSASNSNTQQIPPELDRYDAKKIHDGSLATSQFEIEPNSTTFHSRASSSYRSGTSVSTNIGSDTDDTEFTSFNEEGEQSRSRKRSRKASRSRTANKLGGIEEESSDEEAQPGRYGTIHATKIEIPQEIFEEASRNRLQDQVHNDTTYHDNLGPTNAEKSQRIQDKGTQTILSKSSDTSLISVESNSSVNYEPYEPHIFTESGDLDDIEWRTIQTQLPEDWMWDIDYHVTHGIDERDHGCLTCTPTEPDDPKNFPLTIAGAPVVLPVEYQWPPIAGVNPPPDPRPSALIDCTAKLSLEIIRDLFLTYEGSIGFYLLINGLLQIIVPEDFDTAWASSHLPHKYGGLKVCYIHQTMEPTMFQVPTKTETMKSKSSQTSQSSKLSSFLLSTRTSSNPTTQSLRINDFIEAKPKSSHRKEKFAGRIGLKIVKDGDPYLVMSSHVITEAILAKGLWGRREKIEKLDEDWNQHVDIWAGNEKIGTIDQNFDPEAEIYPSGFKHDITIIKAMSSSATKDIISPLSDLGWLSRESWHTLRQRSSAVKFHGHTESHRSAKTLKTSRPSEVLVVGEGIFLNQSGGKPSRDHDISTWKDLVSRALLYRVYPDFDPPNGYSGIALYAEGTREDGSEGPGVVGFQSFVQRSGHVQSFEMEGGALEKRLKLGRVAFYGAFMVPEVLKKEYAVA